MRPIFRFCFAKAGPAATPPRPFPCSTVFHPLVKQKKEKKQQGAQNIRHCFFSLISGRSEFKKNLPLALYEAMDFLTACSPSKQYALEERTLSSTYLIYLLIVVFIIKKYRKIFLVYYFGRHNRLHPLNNISPTMFCFILVVI